MYSSRESNKINSTLIKKSSDGPSLDNASQSGQSQIKLMPIFEGGEAEEKIVEQPATRLHKEISFAPTTLDWTPNEYVSRNRRKTEENPSGFLF